MTAYGTEFFLTNDVNRLRSLQDVTDRRRLAASWLEISNPDGHQKGNFPARLLKPFKVTLKALLNPWRFCSHRGYIRIVLRNVAKFMNFPEGDVI